MISHLLKLQCIAQGQSQRIVRHCSYRLRIRNGSSTRCESLIKFSGESRNMRILVQRQVRSADSVNLNPILRDRIPAETVILNSGKFRVPCVQQDDAARVRSDSIVDGRRAVAPSDSQHWQKHTGAEASQSLGIAHRETPPRSALKGGIVADHRGSKNAPKSL